MRAYRERREKVEIYSPKDGFVVDVHIGPKQSVSEGLVLFQLDSEWEDKIIEQLRLTRSDAQ